MKQLHDRQQRPLELPARPREHSPHAHPPRGHHHLPPDRACTVRPQPADVHQGRIQRRPSPRRLHGQLARVAPQGDRDQPCQDPPLRQPRRAPLYAARRPPRAHSPRAQLSAPPRRPDGDQRQPANRVLLPRVDRPLHHAHRHGPPRQGERRRQLWQCGDARHRVPAGHLASHPLRHVRLRVQVSLRARVFHPAHPQPEPGRPPRADHQARGRGCAPRPSREEGAVVRRRARPRRRARQGGGQGQPRGGRPPLQGVHHPPHQGRRGRVPPPPPRRPLAGRDQRPRCAGLSACDACEGAYRAKPLAVRAVLEVL